MSKGVPGLIVRTTPDNRHPSTAAISCRQKARYSKMRTAKSEAKRMLAAKPYVAPLAVYPCEFCKGWHVGKAAKTILSRIQIVQPAPTQGEPQCS